LYGRGGKEINYDYSGRKGREKSGGIFMDGYTILDN